MSTAFRWRRGVSCNIDRAYGTAEKAQRKKVAKGGGKAGSGPTAQDSPLAARRGKEKGDLKRENEGTSHCYPFRSLPLRPTFDHARGGKRLRKEKREKKPERGSPHAPPRLLARGATEEREKKKTFGTRGKRGAETLAMLNSSAESPESSHHQRRGKGGGGDKQGGAQSCSVVCDVRPARVFGVGQGGGRKKVRFERRERRRSAASFTSTQYIHAPFVAISKREKKEKCQKKKKNKKKKAAAPQPARALRHLVGIDHGSPL